MAQETPEPTLYERWVEAQAAVPPPTPTQAELDAIATGNYTSPAPPPLAQDAEKQTSAAV